MTNRSTSLFAIGFALFALAVTQRAGAQDTALEQEALSLLSRYLRIDTTNPPGNEIRTAQFFKAIFDREGIESRIFEPAPGRGNIYARLRGDGSKKAVVLLMSCRWIGATGPWIRLPPSSRAITCGDAARST